MMKNKLRSFMVLAALAVCFGTFSVTAYAQSNEPQTEPAPVEETTEPKETAEPNPFTPNGTGTVLDNATSEDEKEFYTIVTEDENVFYLVIDKQRDTENVYFLNAVTGSDLMALAEPDAEETTEPVEPEPEPTPAPEPEEPVEVIEEPEPEPAPETGTSPVMLVLIGVAVLAVGGLGYYFKIYKPKHELDDAADLDEFEFAGPEEPTIREEDLEEPAPELTAEEEAEQRRLYEEEQELPDEDEDAPIQ